MENAAFTLTGELKLQNHPPPPPPLNHREVCLQLPDESSLNSLTLSASPGGWLPLVGAGVEAAAGRHQPWFWSS